MKRLNLLALASLLLLSVFAAGCSEPEAPAAGGAMMNDGSKMMDGGDMMKDSGMKKEDAMMKDDGMMNDDKMMKEEGKD
jgi:hypothetical protein